MNVLKKAVLALLFSFGSVVALACPACEKQQPKILQGITHGTGPESQWDYAIVWVIVVITLLTLFYSVKWMIRPGEKNADHIKQFILND